jgi:hypothetical protein
MSLLQASNFRRRYTYTAIVDRTEMSRRGPLARASASTATERILATTTTLKSRGRPEGWPWRLRRRGDALACGLKA